MSILAQLVIAFVIFAAGAAGGIKWHAGQDAIAENARREAANEKRRMDAKQIDTAAGGHERDKRQIKTEFVTITEEVERVVEKPVYRDVCLDDDGLRLLRSAIGPAAAASEPARTVPGPAPAN